MNPVARAGSRRTDGRRDALLIAATAGDADVLVIAAAAGVAGGGAIGFVLLFVGGAPHARIVVMPDACLARA